MTNLNFPNIAQDGTDQTGVTAPTGAIGIRGWLSSIYSLFNAGAARTRLTDGTNNAAVSSAGAISVNVVQTVEPFAAVGVDNTTVFNAGTSSVSIQGAVYNDAIANANSGDLVGLRATQYRGVHTNLRTSGGVELGTVTTPLVANIQGQAGSISSGTITAASASVTGIANSTSIINAAVATAGNFTMRVSGTYVAVFNFEATDDSGTTWFPITGGRNDGSGADSITPTLTNVVQSWDFSAPGYTHIRIRCSSYTSGTVNVRIVPGGFLYEPVPIVLQEQIVKGVQNIRGISTQDLKDGGRVNYSVSTSIAGVTAVITEALLTLNIQRDGVAGASVTTFPVTAGKRLRLNSICIALEASSATAISGRICLRIINTGAVSTTSPILHIITIPTGAAMIGGGNSIIVTLPDGIEISGNQQFGLSQLCSLVTGTLWVSLAGFEY